MTEEQFVNLMSALGFGFGSLFWFAFIYFIFGWHGRS